MPDEDKTIKIIHDPEGVKLVDKIFERYVRRGEDGNYAHRPAFHIALDRMILSFGGKPYEEDADGKKVDDGEDQGADIHDADAAEEEVASIDDVRDALRRVLARNK